MLTTFITAALTTYLLGATTGSVSTDPGPPRPRGERGGFERWDLNHNGVLDREEFAQAMRGLRERGGDRGRGSADAGPMPPFPRRPGGPGPDLDRHIRDVVRESLERFQRQRQERIGWMIQEAVERALRDWGGPRAERRGPPPGFGVRRGPGGGPDGRRQFGGARQPDGPPPPRECNGAGAPPPGRGGKGGTDGDDRRSDRFFERFDENNDGVVTPDEFRGPPERFGRADRNHDGKIDREELREIVRE